jgi:hypothetical protein
VALERLEPTVEGAGASAAGGTVDGGQLLGSDGGHGHSALLSGSLPTEDEGDGEVARKRLFGWERRGLRTANDHGGLRSVGLERA